MGIKPGRVVMVSTPSEPLTKYYLIKILLDKKDNIYTFIPIGIVRANEQVFYKGSKRFHITRSATYYDVVAVIELKNIPDDLKGRILKGVFRAQ